MAIFTQNSKMKDSSSDYLKIVGFALAPKSTCPFAGTCKKYCYACKGFYRVHEKACRSRWESNKALTETKAGWETIRHEIRRLTKGKRKLAIRLHTEGDFYSPKYADQWLDTAKQFPEVSFYAYSKSWRYFTGKKLPANLSIIASEGGKDDKRLSSWDGPVARIYNGDLPNNGVEGSDDDKVAMMARGKQTIWLRMH